MFVQSVWFVKEHATGNGNGGKAKDTCKVSGKVVSEAEVMFTIVDK